jgi:hypothetical protein
MHLPNVLLAPFRRIVPAMSALGNLEQRGRLKYMKNMIDKFHDQVNLLGGSARGEYVDLPSRQGGQRLSPRGAPGLNQARSVSPARVGRIGAAMAELGYSPGLSRCYGVCVAIIKILDPGQGAR